MLVNFIQDFIKLGFNAPFSCKQYLFINVNLPSWRPMFDSYQKNQSIIIIV